jgi:hypothetical protein
MARDVCITLKLTSSQKFRRSRIELIFVIR